MKVFASTMLLLTAFLIADGCGSLKPTEEEIAAADYGAYPSNYEQILQEWLVAKSYQKDRRGVDQLPARYAEIVPPEKVWFMGDGSQENSFRYGYAIVVKYLEVNERLGGRTNGETMTNSPISANTYSQSEYRLTLFVQNGTVVDWMFDQVK